MGLQTTVERIETIVSRRQKRKADMALDHLVALLTDEERQALKQCLQADLNGEPEPANLQKIADGGWRRAVALLTTEEREVLALWLEMA